VGDVRKAIALVPSLPLVVLLVAAIRFYRLLVRPWRARYCLFRETCSIHVERLLLQRGARAAWNGLRWRHRVCRSGYVLWKSQSTTSLRLADGTIVPETEISPALISDTLPIA
jgi:putative component of membrane protein insertase Oxa1/YidC/SpoIIIJ protein YidD